MPPDAVDEPVVEVDDGVEPVVEALVDVQVCAVLVAPLVDGVELVPIGDVPSVVVVERPVEEDEVVDASVVAVGEVVGVGGFVVVGFFTPPEKAGVVARVQFAFRGVNVLVPISAQDLPPLVEKFHPATVVPGLLALGAHAQALKFIDPVAAPVLFPESHVWTTPPALVAGACRALLFTLCCSSKALVQGA